MKGDPRVIEALNEALTAELTAVNQYFIASKMAANWGYPKLAQEYYEESIDEMKHADSIIERILFLDGAPNMQRLFPVQVGESVVEQFRLNSEMEKVAAQRYRTGSALCIDADDPGSRVLLEKLLADEEAHVDEAEAHLMTLDQLGEPLWLSQWL
jgi:bacterioferritin